MTAIAISVGMPVRNAAEFVAAAIESLLSQTLTGFELIISDNASSDATPDICAKYARQDSRIRVVRQPRNLGVSANYREVACLATAPLFKWASSSDLISSNFLETGVRLLDQRHDCVLCLPVVRLFEESIADSTEFRDDPDLDMDDPVDRFIGLLSGMTLSNALNGVMRRAILKRAGFMPDYSNSDVAVLAELALAGKFARLGEATFYRRMVPQSATRLQPIARLEREYFPTRGMRMYGRFWRRYAALLGAIRRARLTPKQRRRAYLHVLRMVNWDRSGLLADAGEFAAALVRPGQGKRNDWIGP